jgi:hypothetical protein
MAFSIRLHFRIQAFEGTAALAAANINSGIHQNTVFKAYKIKDKHPRTVPGKACNNVPPYGLMNFRTLRLILGFIRSFLGYILVFIHSALPFFILLLFPFQFFLTLFK